MCQTNICFIVDHQTTHSSCILHIILQNTRPPTDLEVFQNRCDATTTSGLSGSDAYVDCIDGKVRGNPSKTCADACKVNGVSKCCYGDRACDGFTGKGERRFIGSTV